MMLNWDRDRATAIAATQFPLEIQSQVPAEQVGGRGFALFTWNRRALQPAHWPGHNLISDPRQIIELFAAEHYLEALAMVVSWGTMWRQPDAIYGARDLRHILAALQVSALSIQESNSIGHAWETLTGYSEGQLEWSAVIASKTLHFLCRALGFQRNPPAAIDNAIILNKI